MYLASPIHGSQRGYQIRHSYLETASGEYRSRLIFELGDRPADHIRIRAADLPVFDDELDRAVAAQAGAGAHLILEQLLWSFLPAETRHQLSRFPRGPRKVPGPITPEDRHQIARQVHLFDRRRLYYLHYRAIDQSRLFSLREKALRPLLGQSRDEREYWFRDRERDLGSGEYRNYLYASLDLQRHFSAGFAHFLPEGLDPDRIADALVGDLCRLNTDRDFWKQQPADTSLHPQLVRYLLMFFDYPPGNRTFADEFVRRFVNSHRRWRWPQRQSPVSAKRLGEIFATPSAELEKMSRRQITRLFHRLALKLHPDQGGDQERFMELYNAYRYLIDHRK